VRRKQWFAWHGALGCTAGLLLFVVCWSGTFAVFSREFDWLIDERLRAPHAGTIAWGAAYEAMTRSHPEQSIVQLNAPYAPGFALEAWTEDRAGVMGRLYADPASGALLGATSYFNVQRFFRSLHMCLFLAAPWGYWIVGAMGVVLLLSLATALGFWARFWRGVRIAPWRPSTRRSWSDAHKAIGLGASWFALLMGLTGVWYWAEPYLPEPPERAAGALDEGDAPPSPEALAGAVRAAEQGGFVVRAISFGEPGSGVLEFHGQDGGWLVRDRAARVWFDLAKGEVIARQRVADLTLYERWIDTADPIHFGSFGGLATKGIWFLAGLGLSALCLSGARIALRDAPQSTARTSTRLAYAVTLAVLAAASVAGASEIRGYAKGGDAWPPTSNATVVVISLWIASTAAALAWWMRRCRAPRGSSV
jgi:uncharacterized iron-regulated membrane protein